MPVLVRYCLSMIWPPFIVATGTTVFILNLLYYLQEFLNYLLIYRAGIENSFLLLLYIQPSFLILAVPIGLLTAVLAVFGRLSADRESMALETCGLSIWQMVWPALAVAALVSFSLVFIMDSLLPWGNVSFLKLQYKIISKRSAVIIRERVFIKDFDGYVLYVGRKDDRLDILRDVTVQLLDEKGYPHRLIMAKQGTVLQDPGNLHAILQLNDGVMQQLGSKHENKLDEFFQMQFSSCALDLSAHRLTNGPVDFRSPRNISIKELGLQIQKEKGLKKDTRYEELEYHKKFSLPFSALAFAFIGIPLGLLSRSGSFGGSFLAVVIWVVYLGFIIFGENGGPMGVVSPFSAMWLPNAVLTLLGLVLLYRYDHKQDFWRSLFFRSSFAGNKRGSPPPALRRRK